ncbi:MAG: hypothetical protein B6D72_04505 [gamma proteobacterium symbiont of Ctena orbiculata]|nr:hypothetical protein [Candidatus Thiodiazotropha taylori]PUB89300.1 MAG: hypothetical protein DBP00_03040 [gamma proteobacterium symbiont of Ctena orbiculata]MBT2995321.1 hypothetical protein [Candidatus Thiodiazotropha taylori]MBT3001781.1 hypothetical protein [Candidatus Thiodiazotropha taylori]MBT3028645.1 hypothetical protein [Candidatus Thiodiazotropha taylori]
MDIKQALALTLVSSLTLGITTQTHARNCIKGKPCGRGCIALDKTCRIDSNPGSNDNTFRYDPGRQPGAIIHRTRHRLPRVHRITAASVAASASPNSAGHNGRRYRQGQRVFVYETYNDWARISNMQPDEWIELKHLSRVGE